MKKQVLELTKRFLSEKIGRELDESVPPVYLSGWDVVTILWSLNDIFFPRYHQIKTVKYRARCESGVDKAIEDFAYRPVAETWNDLTPCVWRVLLERHQQMLIVASINEVENNERFMVLPHGLPEDAILPATMLFWLHSMELPYPVKDRSKLELPENFPDGPMRLQ